MCYAKPGPRCTSHARNQLIAAQVAYATDRSFENFEKLKVAQAEYDMTPGGQRELLKTIMKDGDETGLLNTRLTYGRQMRLLALAAIKTDDQGDNDNHAEQTERNKQLDAIRESNTPSAERLALIERYITSVNEPGMKEHSLRELSRIRSMLQHPTARNENTPVLTEIIDEELNKHPSSTL